MDGYNGSHPGGQQGKIVSLLCWLWATAISGWGWSKDLLHAVPAKQRRPVVFLQRHRWLIFGGLTLLLAIYIQCVLPQWSVYSVQFLQENLLVAGTAVFLLLFFLVWKLPKSQVAFHCPDTTGFPRNPSG
jgi:hypothetical protein